MRNATELMISYAQYHRDQRNIATHFVGIPLIVFAVGVLLAKPGFVVAGLNLTPAWVAWALSSCWYLSRGNLVLAVAVSTVNFVLIALAQTLGSLDTVTWLAAGVGAFVVGWVVQFIGHYYEGRKPAFVDDLVGLLVGPMFVVAEALFAIGWRRDLLSTIEQSVGPTVLRNLHPKASR